MCIVRKPRSTYTIEEDVVALREVTAPSSGVFSGGSASAKLEQWVDVAQRVSALGVDVTGDGLRRHVSGLVKKYKTQGPEPPGGRMRWGIPWPKSDEEIERERLVVEYMNRLRDSKESGSVSRSTARDAPPKKPAQVTQVPSAPARPTIPIPVAQCMSTAHSATKKRPSPVVISDEEDTFDDWSLDTPSNEPATTGESAKLVLKRRRLEMEERTQNRMLDIQAEQIKLQREQLRVQADAMRAMAESAQAIARAVQALQKRFA